MTEAKKKTPAKAKETKPKAKETKPKAPAKAKIDDAAKEATEDASVKKVSAPDPVLTAKAKKDLVDALDKAVDPFLKIANAPGRTPIGVKRFLFAYKQLKKALVRIEVV